MPRGQRYRIREPDNQVNQAPSDANPAASQLLHGLPLCSGCIKNRRQHAFNLMTVFLLINGSSIVS